MTIIFYGNDGSNVSLRHDNSSTAHKRWHQWLGVPRQHIRVGEFACVVGNDDIFVGEQYGGGVEKQQSPTDRTYRMELLDIVERRISKKNPYYKRVLAAIVRERELYMPQWYVFLRGGKFKVPVRPSATIDEARKAYLKAIGHIRMSPGAALARI